jgi:hypothetical protein
MMNLQTPNSSSSESESGQAAALVALMLFFAFLAFAALAIDGAMTYSIRRDAQNVADSAALAACRVLANNDTTLNSNVQTAASLAAQNSIITHLGSLAPYGSPNEGTGVGLVRGIEVSAQEVRVAVMRQIPTVLTQFTGRGDSFINAQARCDSRAGGGLLPIAVQRYDGGTGGGMTDYVAKKGSPVYPNDSVTITIDYPVARYPTQGFQVPVPCGNPNATATGACTGGVSYVASDGALADANTGPEVLLLGSSAETNNGESSMRDLVLLDIRNIASGNALEYYNGANSQADAAKYMSRDWIRQHGYPGPYPQVGSQVAILDGASDDFTTRAMINDAKYRPGDAVAAIVYDGFVWSRPDFLLTFKPQSGRGIVTGYPSDSTSAVAYNLRIDKAGPASAGWFAPQNFNLKFVFNNGSLPAGSHVTIDGVELTGPDYAHTVNNVSSTGWGGVVRIWNTEAITIAQYLTGINIIAESNLGQVHGPDPSVSQYVQFGFWNGTNINADYTARSNDGKLFVRQGGNYQANLVAHGIGADFPGGAGCGNVPVVGSLLQGGAPQNWNSYFSSSPNATIDIKANTDKSINLPLNVNVGALVGNTYVLRLTVGPKSCSGETVPVHTVDVPLEVQPPAPNATPDKFVVIQGYAVFRISRSDANDVWAYAISPLYESYEDIYVGLRPRLVPWN